MGGTCGSQSNQREYAMRKHVGSAVNFVRIYPSLRMSWRPPSRSATMRRSLGFARMTSEQLQCFLALAVGFAVAGMLVSGYQALTARRPSFDVLISGMTGHALAAMPFLMFAAPFLVLCGAVQPEAGARSRFVFAMVSMIVAGSWSILSGSLLVMALRACGLLHA
jgi:hypothetical protein